jgi:hypothetical protein
MVVNFPVDKNGYTLVLEWLHASRGKVVYGKAIEPDMIKVSLGFRDHIRTAMPNCQGGWL